MGDPKNLQSETAARGLARFLPRQTISLSDAHGVHTIVLSPVKRLMAITGISALVIWGVIATVTLIITSLSEDHMRQRSATLTLAYENRLAELTLERDLLADQLTHMTGKVLVAQDQMVAQQMSVLQLDAERSELDAQYNSLQSRLAEITAERDQAAAASQRRARELAAAQSLMVERLGGQDDVETTISVMTQALADAVEARDTIQADLDRLTEEIAANELQQELAAQRQDRLLSQLEGAIQMSLVPLSAMFDAAGMDVDALLANVRQNYSGTGGISAELAESDNPQDARMAAIFEGLDNLAMLNIAASEVPLAMPVRTAFRFSSGFGPRNGRMHKGVDLAGAHGSPIYSTAEGVVSFAGQQRGFGNIVIVDHQHGFQTYYAHMSRIAVTRGQVVARGDRLGDMGSTGHSTGNHLHYEIHKDGIAINPMTFIKAGRNVY